MALECRAPPAPQRNRKLLQSKAIAIFVALFAMYYNFVRIHKTLRTTPAMAAKVTERLWEIGDIVNVLEAWGAAK